MGKSNLSMCLYVHVRRVSGRPSVACTRGRQKTYDVVEDVQERRGEGESEGKIVITESTLVLSTCAIFYLSRLRRQVKKRKKKKNFPVFDFFSWYKVLPLEKRIEINLVVGVIVHCSCGI